jgi:hypothetical protein
MFRQSTLDVDEPVERRRPRGNKRRLRLSFPETGGFMADLTRIAIVQDELTIHSIFELGPRIDSYMLNEEAERAAREAKRHAVEEKCHPRGVRLNPALRELLNTHGQVLCALPGDPD